MSAPSLKSYRVVVIEWLSHKAIIETASPEEAESEARQVFAENAEPPPGSRHYRPIKRQPRLSDVHI